MRLTEEQARALEARIKARRGVPASAPKRSKYGNVKMNVKGEIFDSKREYQCYLTLLADQQAGKIKKIERQVEFVLLESFEKNGVAHRGIAYRADFVVTTKIGLTRVVDAKGLRDKVFRIKQKLFEARYPQLTIELW